MKFSFGPDHRRGYHHGRLKDALVEAARALVSERGLAGFTLAEAAKLVGVTGAAPYRHFTDRDALMAELARRGFEAFGDRLRGAWREGRPDPHQALRRMGGAYLAFVRAEPGLYAAMFGTARLTGAPQVDGVAARAFGILQEAATAILPPGAAGEAHALALQLWALSHGVATLMTAGHLDASRASDPLDVLEGGAGALMDAALRRIAAKC
jgi:AcrR family transcriptional regulator